MDQRNLNGKGLMVSITEEPRSLSPSPYPMEDTHQNQHLHQQHNHMMMMPMQHHSGSGSGYQMMGGDSNMPPSHNMSAPGGGGGGGAGSSGGMDNGRDSPYVQEQDDDSAEGEQQSQFGRAKKPKRKAAPRTSRACLACRRQKMRCEGAENPPCRRCIANEVDCMFERRSDYLLNPEDRAWQNGVEKRLEHLSRTIDMILAHLGGGGGGPPAAGAGGPPPHTAGVAFPEMPSAAAGHGGAAAYYESYERHGIPPNTAPPGTALSHHSAMGDPTMMQAGNGPQGRINYVVPSAAETAAIAAQARLKRQRGNTLPNLPSATTGGFTHGSPGFQLFSPRTGALDTAGLPAPFTYGASAGDALTPGLPTSAHPHHRSPLHEQQQQSHPFEIGIGQSGSGGSGGHPSHQYAHTPQHAYSFDAYPGGADLGPPPHGHPHSHHHHNQHPGHQANLPASASSPTNPGGHSGSFSVDNDKQQQQQQSEQTHQSTNATSTAGNVADLVPRSLGSPAVRFAHHQSISRSDIGGELGPSPLHSTEGTA